MGRADRRASHGCRRASDERDRSTVRDIARIFSSISDLQAIFARGQIVAATDCPVPDVGPSPFTVADLADVQPWGQMLTDNSPRPLPPELPFAARARQRGPVGCARRWRSAMQSGNVRQAEASSWRSSLALLMPPLRRKVRQRQWRG
jgi:hypothetical protein